MTRFLRLFRRRKSSIVPMSRKMRKQSLFVRVMRVHATMASGRRG